VSFIDSGTRCITLERPSSDSPPACGTETKHAKMKMSLKGKMKKQQREERTNLKYKSTNDFARVQVMHSALAFSLSSHRHS
jgi:hypothetical protein